MQSILDYETVDYDKINNALVIIDQTQLPGKITLISLHTAEEIWNAIYQLKVRGAPAIGVASAIGLAVLAKEIKYDTIDTFFEDIRDYKGGYNFFFPPYSVLFWHNADKKGYIKPYLDAKKYFVKKAIQLNHNVYDFQSEELIGDLDNYTDTTHYKPEINDWMTKCFYNNSNLVNDEITAENETKLLSILQKFSINNHY